MTQRVDRSIPERLWHQEQRQRGDGAEATGDPSGGLPGSFKDDSRLFEVHDRDQPQVICCRNHSVDGKCDCQNATVSGAFRPCCQKQVELCQKASGRWQAAESDQTDGHHQRDRRLAFAESRQICQRTQGPSKCAGGGDERKEANGHDAVHR